MKFEVEGQKFALLRWCMNSQKNFGKNRHFGNIRAGFLLRYQNSLGCKKGLICLSNIESLKKKLAIGYVIVPKIGQNII